MMMALAIGASVAGQPSRAWGQAPDDEAILATLDGAIGPQDPPELPEAGDPVAREVQRGLVEIGKYLRSNDRRALERALFRFNQSSTRRPDWPWPEYAMAHAFLLMHDLGAPHLQSEGSTLGESHLAAMWRHLSAALRRDPAFMRGRLLLAELAYASGDRELHDGMLDALTVEVSRRDPLPEALVAWGRHRRTAGDHAVALAIFERAGQLGADASVVALERARTLEALDRPDDARTAYWQGADGITARGRQLYRQDLGWILDDDSLAAFDAVPDGEVAGWLRRFWGERDAAVVQPAGHREVEHLRRWVYAFAHFRVHNPWDRIARTRVDFAFDDIRDQCVGNATSFYQQLPIVPPALPGDVRASESLLDHRGIVYLRHGEPFARAVPPEVLGQSDSAAARAAGIAPGQESERLAESLRNTEIWVYWVDGAWRVFQFRGSDALGHDAATTMSSYLPWQSVQAWQALARIMPGYRAAANWIASYRGVQPHTCLPEVRLAIAEQRDDAMVGINTDTERPPILEPWTVADRFFAIGADRGQPAAALVTFSIPMSQLKGSELRDGRVAWPLHFKLVAYRSSDGTRIDRDTTRIFAARGMVAASFLSGHFVLPLGPGRWQVAILVRQPSDTTAGGYSLRRNLDIGRDNRLLVSDVVTGRGDQPTWDAPDGPFPVNPLGYWPRGGVVELWYQVGGLASGDDYRTILEVMPADQEASGTIRVAASDRATGSVTTVRKSLGLENLAPGRYHLRVTIEAGDRTTTREQDIVVTRGTD